MDNGSQFTSAEFLKFLTTTAPGHPATNGMAERYVGEFKDKLSKIRDTGEPLQTKLDRFLLTYRATPTSLGKSPSELLMNRQPRMRLTILRHKPCKQEVKVFQDDLHNQPRYSLNQGVFARNFGKGGRWVSGNIVRIISPRNINVQVGDLYHQLNSLNQFKILHLTVLLLQLGRTKARILAGSLMCRSLPVRLLKLMKMGLALTQTTPQPKLGPQFLTMQMIAMMCKPLLLQSATHLYEDIQYVTGNRPSGFTEHYGSSII